ncbi:hypothetical protein N7486_005142 [Penicillium sp. IBT 16267x]|nr:hypothetical protein N7486_005142 [Penicillium sp. IBT 16267x]
MLLSDERKSYAQPSMGSGEGHRDEGYCDDLWDDVLFLTGWQGRGGAHGTAAIDGVSRRMRA